MKHYLRFSLMLLLIMLMGGVSFAQETESFNFVGWNFDGASSGWTNTYTAHTVKGSDVTVNFSKASKQASTISDCPVTKGSDITVTLNNQEICTITSIELLLKQWGSKAQTVTLNTSADGKNYTKTTTTSSNFSLTASGLSAKAIKFTFSNKSNQVGVQSIKVTYTKSGSDKTNTTLSFGDLTSKTLLVGETFTATPTLKAGDTEVTGKTLTYKSSDEDVATVSDKGVVEAKKPGNTTITANFAGDDTYSASSASYAVKVAVNDIATLKSLITSTDTKNPQSFTLKLTDAVVTYTNKNNAYIQDASGAIYIYTSHGLDANQKINGFADVKVCKYLGLNEITSWTLADDATVTDDGTFTVETVTLADLTNNFDKYESMPVKVAGATVTKNFTSNQGEISQDGTTFVVYNKGTSSVTLGSIGDNIDIVGYPAIFNSTKQLNLWKQSDVTVNYSQVATTLSFNTTETTFSVTKGEESTFVAPTAIVKDADNNVVENAVVTYKSSKTDVATVAEDGKITFVGYGSTVITASYAGDDHHKAATDISYTLAYGRIPTVMAYSETDVTVSLGSTFTAPTLSLTANGTDILAGKTITYSSTDENVAMVDENGNVVLMDNEGTTTITASFAGDDTYAEATASFTITVNDPNKKEVTFDFTQPALYGYGTSSNSKHDGDVAVDGTIVSGIVTITNTKNGTTTTRFWSNGLKIYNGAILTFSVPEGYKITNITLDGVENLNSNSVTYTVDKNKTLTSLTVTYKESVDYTFDDTQDYTPVLDENKSVKIKRSMSADQLNTICLPFDLSEEQISTTFGSGTEVYEFLGVIDNVLHFSTTAKMSATKPYLITPTETKSELIFSNIDVITDDAASKVTDGEFALCGTFGPATLKTDGTELFLATGGILKKPAQGSNSKIKGFRAYFSVPANTNDAKISLSGFETSIDNISIDGMKLKNNQVYNLNGQLVGNSLNGLAKGIYLMNGKKYVVK